MIVEGAVGFSAVASVGLSLVSIVLGNQESLALLDCLVGRIGYYLRNLYHPVRCQEVLIRLLLE